MNQIILSPERFEDLGRVAFMECYQLKVNTEGE